MIISLLFGIGSRSWQFLNSKEDDNLNFTFPADENSSDTSQFKYSSSYSEESD